MGAVLCIWLSHSFSPYLVMFFSFNSTQLESLTYFLKDLRKVKQFINFLLANVSIT